MRFLNTETYELIESDRAPGNGQYAILSHTWLTNTTSEVTYDDMKDHFQELKDHFEGPRDGQRKEKRKESKHGWQAEGKRAGWQKLTSFCNFAAQYKYDWAWMDTCCINKNNEREVETSVHGMFEFYENSQVCYAYLADVDYSANKDQQKSALKQSRWFTRGWTLQELLAPRTLCFLSKEWKMLVWRNTLTDLPDLHNLVRSNPAGWIRLRSDKDGTFVPFGLASRLSWSSERQTTEVEDQAYAICGLFDIKMRVRYNEGPSKFTFFRFQRALVAKYKDLSLLAWFSTPGNPPYTYFKHHPQNTHI